MTTTYKTSEGRGHWVKNGCYYETNAFESPTDEQSYIISITKDDNRWNVFAEDHNSGDMDDHPENGFKTLTEAKAFAEDFAEYFEHCQDEIAKQERVELEIEQAMLEGIEEAYESIVLDELFA